MLNFLQHRLSHPIFFVTASLAVGIIIQSISELLTIIMLGVILAIYAIHYFAANSKDDAFQSLGLSIYLSFLVGAFSYSIQVQKFHAFYEKIHSKQLSINGTIVEIQKTTNTSFHYCLHLQTKFIQDFSENNEFRFTGTLLLYIKKIDDLRIGDFINLKPVILKKSTKKDFEQYLIKENKIGCLFDKNINIQLIERPTWSFRRFLSEKKELLTQNLSKKMSSTSFNFFSSLFLGKKLLNKKQQSKLRKVFKNWGISHYLARSGLHLLLFILLWVFILQFLPLPLNFKEIFLIILVGLYILLTWSSLSFLRAILMFLLARVYLFLGAQIHSLFIITLVAFMILLSNPSQIFFLDFQLSFGLSGALILFNFIKYYKEKVYSEKDIECAY